MAFGTNGGVADSAKESKGRIILTLLPLERLFDNVKVTEGFVAWSFAYWVALSK